MKQIATLGDRQAREALTFARLEEVRQRAPDAYAGLLRLLAGLVDADVRRAA